MPVTPAPSRLLFVLAVAAILGTAGCGAIGATSPTSEDPEPNTMTVKPGEFPDPPKTLTEERAAETAAYHHLAVLNQRLDIEQPSRETTVPSVDSVTTDTVEGRDGGYYVAVSLSTPTSGTRSVPELAQAVYLVRENVTPRPAFPLHTRAPGDRGGSAGSAVDLRVANFAPDGTTITVVVTALDGTPSTALVRTLDVRSQEGVLLEEAVESPGRYRVTVTMENASRSRTVAISPDGPDSSIALFVEPGGTPAIYQLPG